MKIVDEYGATTQYQTQKVRFWDKIKMGFRGKNFEDFERSITQEIVCMTAVC